MPELMEVLEFLDPTGKVIIKRVPPVGFTEIKWGAQLTVRESQEAIFFRDGKSLDIFGPGRYVLETQNIPVVGKWVTSFGYGPTSPFRAEVYFVNKSLMANIKWGTQEPILFRDSELKMIRLRSFGQFSIQVADSILFLNKIFGTREVMTIQDIQDYLRGIIISKITTVLSQQIKTVFDMPSSFENMNILMRTQLADDFMGLGLYLHDLYVQSISVPDEVQTLIDTRSGMTAVGDMNEFLKFKMANSMEAAAQNSTGEMGTGVGVGAGLGMGFMIPQAIQQAFQASTPEKQREGKGLEAMEKIKKLKELFDIGAITKEEYEIKKSKLMEDI